MGGRSLLAGGQRAAVGPATRHGEAAVLVVPLLLCPILWTPQNHAARTVSPSAAGLRQRTRRNRGGLGIRFTGRSGFQPAMVRAHSRACAFR